MEQIWEAADFIRNVRRCLRRRKLACAPLKLLRLELCGDHAECEWLAAVASADQHSASLQLLEDSLSVREQLFEAIPFLSSAVFRVYRQIDSEHVELIITGTVTPDERTSDDVCSVVMRAQLYGLRFCLDGDILRSPARAHAA